MKIHVLVEFQVMKEPFSMCDPAFLHLVCTECEVVQLPWPKAAFSPDQDEVGAPFGLVMDKLCYVIAYFVYFHAILVPKWPKVNVLEPESSQSQHEIRRSGQKARVF